MNTKTVYRTTTAAKCDYCREPLPQDAMQCPSCTAPTPRQTIAAELDAWATLTGRPLPYPAATIASLEALGFVVDLADGSISPAAELLDQPVALTPAGWAAYRAIQQQKEIAR